ncbi:VOC family protein [Colwellia hornerae]|uniref:Lactoylglutathione lyase n=1 Tax=Colwellia hornerae TaxID=89402 RepID=A0A5C6QP11_9GAMM|nr:VOC family protein [Colwellia hornerae]TWX56210.1 lactoylglutathione lyase [Colwellia hornerae]TWX62061.1 lactoylglutathione lyase [Colwellia hornerae]TWX70463.1 lactoylglutathione lyase [Colwellia hornerae]
MKFLHTMVRVDDLDKSLDFYINQLGLIETKRVDVPKGKFSLIFLATEVGGPEIELTHNWGSEEEYTIGRNFGHLAFEVADIYKTCAALMASGVVINRPPRDGHMAFVKSPDGISIELLQKDDALAPQEPWLSMENQGSW